MTQTYFPFDAGQGASITEAQWSKMAKNFIKTGVLKGYLNEFLVYADSSGLQVKAKTGNAWIEGHFFESDAEVILPISNQPTNNRIDRIIIRLDWTANTIALAVIQGTAALSPTAPALTQNTSRWEISLAQVYIGQGVATIAAGNVTDERNFVKNANTVQSPWTQAVLQNGWLHTSGTPVEYRLNEFGQLELRGACNGGTTAGNTVVFTLPPSLLSSRQKTFKVMMTDGTATTIANGAMWIHATTGEVKGYGALSTQIYFDGLVFSI